MNEDGGAVIRGTDETHEVGIVEHAWVEMSDGCRLAAKLWLPEGAESEPVPAILEYIPYRKNDFTALRDSKTHGYFARCGYASVRVDLRGSGDSDGILADEYLPLEQNDGLEVISWLAKQPWCSGVVGMFGISWGRVRRSADRRSRSCRASCRDQRGLDRRSL